MNKNKKIVYCLSFLLSILLVGNVFGSSVFGPETLIVEKKGKYSSTHGFNAAPGILGKIVITKLSDTGAYKRGRVRLNTEKFKLREFLRSDNTVFEQEIYLQENNKLKIAFRGDIGTALSVEITQEQPPTGSLGSSPNDIFLGESSLLTWTTENADECILSPGIGIVNCNGSIEVTPQVPTEYTLTAVNSVLAEKITASTTIGVRIVIPSAALTASPSLIEQGEISTLTWTSVDADNCNISPDIGPVDCNGSMEIIPPIGTTNYIFTAENTRSGMMTAALAEVGVRVVFPSATISATPDGIELGETTTISWNSTNADNCMISPEIGEVDCNGSLEISPNGTTYYILTAKNTKSGMMASAVAEVGVRVVMPSASIAASPEEIMQGETSLLSWSSKDADECTLYPNIGLVDCKGSIEVTPQGTTDYFFMARNTMSGTATSVFTTVSVTQQIEPLMPLLP